MQMQDVKFERIKTPTKIQLYNQFYFVFKKYQFLYCGFFNFEYQLKLKGNLCKKEKYSLDVCTEI